MLSATIIVVFSCLGLFLQLECVRTKAAGKLQNVQFESLGKKISAVGEVCSSDDIIQKNNFNYCNIGDVASDKSIIFYGDSSQSSNIRWTSNCE